MSAGISYFSIDLFSFCLSGNKDTKTALRTYCGKAVEKKDRPEKNSEPVLQRSWVGIPLKPREFFWAFFGTALVAS